MSELPDPPWRTPSRGRTRRPLSQEAVVDAALAVLDREGLGGLSMRRVAQELGTGPASLYAHVSGKEELLELLLDRVSATITVPEPDPRRWTEQIKDVAWQAYRVYAANTTSRWPHWPPSPPAPTRCGSPRGCWPSCSPAACRPNRRRGSSTGSSSTSPATRTRGHCSARRSAPPARTSGYWTGMLTQLREYYLSLPAERFPHTLANLDALMAGGGDERFAFGLDLLVQGVARYAEPA